MNVAENSRPLHMAVLWYGLRESVGSKRTDRNSTAADLKGVNLSALVAAPATVLVTQQRHCRKTKPQGSRGSGLVYASRAHSSRWLVDLASGIELEAHKQ